MTSIAPFFATALHCDGYVVVESALDEAPVASLSDVLASPAPAHVSESVRTRNGSAYARRNLLELPAIRALADAPALRALIDPILGPSARPVRGILFDKNAGANWKVAWHQDLSIAVRERRDMPGFGPWSVKADVAHVQPPLHVLENMLTVRLHLDNCGEENGPLLVQPGTHALGLIDPDRVAELTREPGTPCLVQRGGVVLMRPLILHASRPARVPGRRRVIHIEYTAGELPVGLRWFVS